MNINKYTEKAQEAVLGAQQLAEKSSHAQVEPEHLLVALVEQRERDRPGGAPEDDADPAAIGRAARELLGKIPPAYGGAQPGLFAASQVVTDLAQAEADRLKDDFVSTEHLLVAIASEPAAPPRRGC